MWLRIFCYLGEEASSRNWSWPSKWTNGRRVQTLVFSTLAGQLGVTRGRSLGPSPFNSNHQELSQVQGLKCTNFVVLLGLVPYPRFLVFFLSCSTSRELPEPLMGGELYQDWLEAGSLVNFCLKNVPKKEMFASNDQLINSGGRRQVWRGVEPLATRTPAQRELQEYPVLVQGSRFFSFFSIDFSTSVPEPGDYIQWTEQNDCQ